MKDCGILLHISSLPNDYGIGNFGQKAYEFADFLRGAGQSYWQVLPLVPTSYGDSPYQSPSSFAGNPYFIDLEALNKEGLISDGELNSAKSDCGAVDYGMLFKTRLPLLKKAYARFTPCAEYEEFVRNNSYWLDSYALFSAIKNRFELRPHWEWPEEFHNPESDTVKEFALSHEYELNFTRFLQYEFDKQWRKLKAYVNSLGIKIIGDAPIYAAYDSTDFWENPHRFVTDENGCVTEVAGVPPDYFSADGQLWGNPLYNWDNLRNGGYEYWILRVRRALELYDYLRIDHFRGFCGYYAIPADSETAKNGVWRIGPGRDLFAAIENAMGKANIIAEDLGVDSPELRELLRECGYPGMKVVQFGFDNPETNAHYYKNYGSDFIGYTGTHDNDTTLGWFNSLCAEEQKRIKSLLPRGCGDIAKAVICALYRTKVKTAIVPMQDWLRQDSRSRMNTPGTREGNWRYRLCEMPPESLKQEMLQCAIKYKRAKK